MTSKHTVNADVDRMATSTVLQKSAPPIRRAIRTADKARRRSRSLAYFEEAQRRRVPSGMSRKAHGISGLEGRRGGARTSATRY